MKVQDLINELSLLPRTLDVLVASDEEGNEYHKIRTISAERVMCYNPDGDGYYDALFLPTGLSREQYLDGWGNVPDECDREYQEYLDSPQVLVIGP